MTLIKICGITNAGDAFCAVENGADALGFIFYEKSDRYVSPEVVGKITRDLPPFVTTVGVLVNETHEQAERIADAAGLQVLQIHGDETPEQCRGYSRPVYRALRVGSEFGPPDIEPYAEAGVTTFMLDKAKDGFYGGTGETFNWELAVLAKSFGRVILSGGLTSENVEEAIETVDPYAVDVGSGVESVPGKKDHEKVTAFTENAWRAGREN